MKLAKLSTLKIAALGLGIENFALLRYLESKKIKADITIYEAADEARLGERYKKLRRSNNISWQLNWPDYQKISGYDLILRSQGVFLSPATRRRLKREGTVISSAMQLFLDNCPSRNIIGVTGTKGKGTTSSLVQAMLKKGGKRTWLAGNIGVAPFQFMSKIKKSDWVVLELSSFHLEDLNSSPRISILTNFSPEHLSSADKDNLNHHVSLKAYWQAKMNIFRFQKKNDLAIINDSLRAQIGRELLPARIASFKKSQLPSALPGEHNKENIAAAELAARAAGVSTKAIAAAVKDFKGLPYRLEKIAVRQGISFYNDSFATTPSSTITALRSFSQPVILIAGGADKGASFNQLAREIKKRAQTLILFSGKGSSNIKSALLKIGYPRKSIAEAKSMSEAFKRAHSVAQSGDIILMSPACASFGLFKNYKDRGEQFNNCVKAS